MTPTDAQDQAWVLAVQRDDDRAAFACLVQRHQGAIRAVLRRLTRGDTALADELAQETFLRAYQALAGFRGQARFRTWLYRIAYNEYLQQRRRGSEQLHEREHPLDDEAPDDAVDAPAALSDTVALAVDLDRALAVLSAAEHDAIVHCYFADLSHTQAAAIMGWPLGTLKTHVLRAKIKLRAALSAWAPEAKQERAA